LTLEPIHSVYQDVSRDTVESFLLLIKLWNKFSLLTFVWSDQANFLFELR
jgi:hypothetical protein